MMDRRIRGNEQEMAYQKLTPIRRAAREKIHHFC
jgi:hypothetical protein